MTLRPQSAALADDDLLLDDVLDDMLADTPPAASSVARTANATPVPRSKAASTQPTARSIVPPSTTKAASAVTSTTQALPADAAALASELAALSLDATSALPPAAAADAAENEGNTLAQLAQLLTQPSSTSAPTVVTGTQEVDPVMLEFERVLQETLAQGSSSKPPPPSSTNQPPKSAASARDHVAQTMSRIKDSSNKARVAAKSDAMAAAAGNGALNSLMSLALGGAGGTDAAGLDGMSDEAIQALISQLAGLETESGSTGGDDSLNTLMQGLMEQLVSREVLLEPMQQLDKRYPEWLQDNRDKITSEDYVRYVAQHNVVRETIAIFGKADKLPDKQPTPDMTTEIMTLMQKMQEYGNPPAEIMTELADASGADASMLFNGMKDVGSAAPSSGATDVKTSATNAGTGKPGNDEDPLADIPPEMRAGLDNLLSSMLNGTNPNGNSGNPNDGTGMPSEAAMLQALTAALGNGNTGVAGGAGGTIPPGVNPNDCSIM